jgi:hypothetical protein
MKIFVHIRKKKKFFFSGKNRIFQRTCYTFVELDELILNICLVSSKTIQLGSYDLQKYSVKSAQKKLCPNLVCNFFIKTCLLIELILNICRVLGFNEILKKF